MSRNRSDFISNSNSSSDIKISKAEYIATVTECLSDHIKCSKHYVDTQSEENMKFYASADAI